MSAKKTAKKKPATAKSEATKTIPIVQGSQKPASYDALFGDLPSDIPRAYTEDIPPVPEDGDGEREEQVVREYLASRAAGMPFGESPRPAEDVACDIPQEAAKTPSEVVDDTMETRRVLALLVESIEFVLKLQLPELNERNRNGPGTRKQVLQSRLEAGKALLERLS